MYTTTLIHINGSSSTLLVENGICTTLRYNITIQVQVLVYTCTRIYSNKQILLIDPLSELQGRSQTFDRGGAKGGQ